MVGWHHQHNGQESEQTLGNSEGQGSLACCSPWGHKESDKTERLNNNKKKVGGSSKKCFFKLQVPILLEINFI